MEALAAAAAVGRATTLIDADDSIPTIDVSERVIRNAESARNKN